MRAIAVEGDVELVVGEMLGDEGNEGDVRGTKECSVSS